MEKMLRNTGKMVFPNMLFTQGSSVDSTRLATDLGKIAANELAKKMDKDAQLRNRLRPLGSPSSWMMSSPRDVSFVSASSFVFTGPGARQAAQNARLNATFDLGSPSSPRPITVLAQARIEQGQVILEELTIDDGLGSAWRGDQQGGQQQGQQQRRKPAVPGVIDVDFKEIKDK